jgi:predicted permease
MSRWARLFSRRERMMEDLDQEIRDFIERETQDNIARGLPPEEAHYAALRKFGNVTRVKEDTWEVWSFVWLEQLWQDIRYGLRMLAKNSGFTAVAVLTLALGIGANTAIFSVVNAVLLKPLGYPSADRLVWLADYDFKYGWGDNWVQPAAYVQWRDEAHSFESMVGYANQDLALSTGGASDEERITSITDGFWGITGAQPALGRLFGPGQPDTMVLSHGLFERRFGGDPQVIGKTVTVNGHPFTITGVLPEKFRFLFPQQSYRGDVVKEIDAYIPIPEPALKLWTVTEQQLQAVNESAGPSPHAVCVIGKLKPDVSMEQARAEMATVFARVAQEHYPIWMRGDFQLHFAPLKEKVVGNSRPALMVMLGAVGFVLLIASANVANLLLARASTRRREVAIRAALGAGRGRLIRQFLAESILLALFGGAAGVLVARWTLAAVVGLGAGILPRVGEATLDASVLLFALAVSLATGVLFGLGPALSFGRVHLHDMLKDDARASSVSATGLRVRGVVVAGELALAIVLLTGAGLMLRSFWQMNTYPPGFAPEKVLVMRVALSGPEYNAWLREDAYIHELMRRVKSAPGVQEAGIDRSTLNVNFRLEGSPPGPSDHQPEAAFRAVSPGYLRALGVPLIKGSWPRDDESFDSLMVNETFVRTMMGSDNPIGRRIDAKFLNGVIVGVVADFKYWQLDAEPVPEVYFPYPLSPAGRSIRVIVRTSGDPKTLEPIIRKLALGIDPTQPVYELKTLDQALSDSIAPRRFNMYLLGTFAAIALLMGVIGIYGVMAFWVIQRSHEIGIRMALGAKKWDVVAMVLGQGLKMAGIGLGIGMVGAVALNRFFSSLLYGVKPTDPFTFAAVSLMMISVALLACYIPARRATKVDPMAALRYE